MRKLRGEEVELSPEQKKQNDEIVRDLQNLKSFGVSAVAALQFKNSERPTTG